MKSNKPLIIGICGVAGSGKDTFFELLNRNLPNVRRFALADSLKAELNPFFKKSYGVDIFTCDRAMKENLRPILVAHGKMRRLVSNGRHWVEILRKKIESHLENHPNDTIVVTDVRYDFYNKDEIFWLKDEMGGQLVHVERTEKNGKIVLPANKDEEENDPKLIAKANFKVKWPTVLNIKNNLPELEYLDIYAKEFLKYINR